MVSAIDSATGRPGAWAQWIEAARGGCREALGRLLQGCRQYLLLVANQELASDLRNKLGPSDVVQETFLEAQRDFARFHGGCQAELLAWLRTLLPHNLANVRRGYRDTGKRQLDREMPFDQAPPDELFNGIASRADSPRSRLVAHEQAEELDGALGRLPEHYREVILLHHREGLAFEA